MKHRIKQVWMIYCEEGYGIALTEEEAKAMQELADEIEEKT